MLEFKDLDLGGVVEITPTRHADDRGFFAEVYNKSALAEAGITEDFVQDNHSLSTQKNVLRGLHFQTPPFAQAKLVRVTRGAVFDVAVDLRVGAPSFGKWVGVELTAERGNQLFVPKGFAHGFLTLTENVEFLYKVSAPYSRAHDRSIRFNDAQIGIQWPLSANDPILSQKDRDAPLLSETQSGFVFGEM